MKNSTGRRWLPYIGTTLLLLLLAVPLVYAQTASYWPTIRVNNLGTIEYWNPLLRIWTAIGGGSSSTLADRAPVDAVCTTNQPNVAPFVCDGVTASCASGRCTEWLLTGQSLGTENGIYTLSGSTRVRRADFSTDAQLLAGARVHVQYGAVFPNTDWTLQMPIRPASMGITYQYWKRYDGRINALAYGAYPNAREVIATCFGLGTTTLTGTDTDKNCFGPADVGSTVIVRSPLADILTNQTVTTSILSATSCNATLNDPIYCGTEVPSEVAAYTGKDSTPAFASAAAAAVAESQYLYIPPGMYITTSPIDLSGSATQRLGIAGESSHSTRIVSSSDTSVIQIRSGYATVNDLEITALSWPVVNTLADVGVVDVRGVSAPVQGASIGNLVIDGAPSAALYLDTLQSSQVYHVTTEGARGDSLVLTSPAGVQIDEFTSEMGRTNQTSTPTSCIRVMGGNEVQVRDSHCTVQGPNTGAVSGYGLILVTDLQSSYDLSLEPAYGHTVPALIENAENVNLTLHLTDDTASWRSMVLGPGTTGTRVQFDLVSDADYSAPIISVDADTSNNVISGRIIGAPVELVPGAPVVLMQGYRNIARDLEILPACTADPCVSSCGLGIDASSAARFNALNTRVDCSTPYSVPLAAPGIPPALLFDPLKGITNYRANPADIGVGSITPDHVLRIYDATGQEYQIPLLLGALPPPG